jgi:hypothetical protein
LASPSNFFFFKKKKIDIYLPYAAKTIKEQPQPMPSRGDDFFSTLINGLVQRWLQYWGLFFTLKIRRSTLKAVDHFSFEKVADHYLE